MAYNDYGAFVWRNHARRPEREDVPVWGGEGYSDVPSGGRVYLNALRGAANGREMEWWEHVQHGVLGSGRFRVACFKQGLPTFWEWPEGAWSPVEVDLFPCPEGEDPHGWRYFSGRHEAEHRGYMVVVDGPGPDPVDGRRYECHLFEPDGTTWDCEYDYGFGAGISDSGDKWQANSRMVDAFARSL